MENLEQELKEYYKNIKKEMVCSNNTKRAFIKVFKNRIADYLDENSNVTMESIYDNFGTVDEIVKNFDDEKDYYKNKAKKRLIISIIIAVVSVFLISLLIYAIYDLINSYGGHITVTTTVK